MNEVQEYEFDSIYNKEPNKCYGWFWTNVKNMRRNIDKLFHPLQDFLNKFPQIKSTIDIKNMVKFSGTLSDSISGSRSNSISVTVSEGSDLISQNITEEMN